MAAEAELKISITPVFEDVADLAGQMRRTGESLIAAADSLQRLSDGSPDAARTRPDNYRHECPFVTNRVVHDVHTITVRTFAPGTVDEITTNFDCPGFPVRPWHPDSDRTP
jgi:hypothetical protein